MKEVDIISKVVGRDTSGKTAMYIPGAGAPSVNLDDYLLKKIWDSVFEIRTDSEGNPYLFEKMPFVTQYGITMYADGGELNLPSIYAGLPIDGSTLIRDDNGVLMINPDIDLGGGASTWDELIGKPSWIGNTKPSYSYSEIEGTPDLSVYVTSTALSNALADYVKSSVFTSELAKYVTLGGDETISGLKDFTKGLKISGLGITKSQDDVIYLDANLVVRGGITMYADNTVDVGSIYDGLPVDGSSIYWENGVLKAKEVSIPEVTEDATFYYEQGTASDKWIVVHNLNKRPCVMVFDSANDEVKGNIIYDNLNQITLTFSASFTGYAILN